MMHKIIKIYLAEPFSFSTRFAMRLKLQMQATAKISGAIQYYVRYCAAANTFQKHSIEVAKLWTADAESGVDDHVLDGEADNARHRRGDFVKLQVRP